MNKIRKILGMLVLSVAFLVMVPAVTAKADGLTGLYPGNDGNWYYYTDGQVNANYTNLVANEAGWWYVENGCINTGYTGLVCSPDYGWWYVENGAINFGYTGLVCSPDYGWWYIENGAINFGYTGLIPNDYGWWYVENGTIAFWYTGLAANEAGWWYVENGAINFGYNGLVPNEAGWWLVQNGAINFGYTGLVPNEYGWWFVENGAINFGFTGMAANEAGWWYVENGGINFGYTGLCSNEAGTWYFQNGMLDFSYSGTVTVNGVRHMVTNGLVTGVQQLTCNLPENSEFYKYEYAYKNNDTSGLAEKDIAFYNGFKAYLDYAYQFDTLYEQEKAIHDYMVLNCDYDHEGYVNGTAPWDSYWEEGVIVNKKAVCNGYAYAFKLFMDVLGIECKVIVGIVSPEMDHAWNAIKLDGEWYLLDVTWDDLGQDYVYYNYFNIPSEIMDKDHFTKDLVATGMKYSADEVLVVTSDADFATVNEWLKQIYLQSESETFVRIFVKQPDGSRMTEAEQSEIKHKLWNLSYYLGGFDDCSGVYNGDTFYMLTLSVEAGEKALREITSDISPVELREMAAQWNKTINSDVKLRVELKIPDGSISGESDYFYKREFLGKYENALLPYFSVESSNINETHMVLLCRQYDGGTENDYRIRDAYSARDVDIASFVQYLDACPVNDIVNIVLENTQWEYMEISRFVEDCIPTYAVTYDNRSGKVGEHSWKYEDGSMIIPLKKIAEIKDSDLEKDSECNLEPFNEYYKYEYAYRTNDTSKLTAEDMAFYNGMKEYLDFAYQFTTDYQRIKAVYDFMIQNCCYENSYDGAALSIPYSVFVEKKANFNGYNETFKLCMDILGIECQTVRANVCAVCVDGKWYLADPGTAAESALEPGFGINRVNYQYLFVPVSEFGWSAQNVRVEANDYYVHDTVTITSLNDTTELVAMMKNAFNTRNLDTTFFRVLVKKADSTAWTKEQAGSYNALLAKSNYGNAFACSYRIVNDDALMIQVDGYFLPSMVMSFQSDAAVEETDCKLISAFEASKEIYGITVCFDKADGTDWEDYSEASSTIVKRKGIATNLYGWNLVCLDGNTAVFYYKPNMRVQMLEYTISGAASIESIDLSGLVTESAEKLPEGGKIILQLRASENVTWDQTSVNGLCERLKQIESITTGTVQIYSDGNAALCCTYSGAK